MSVKQILSYLLMCNEGRFCSQTTKGSGARLSQGNQPGGLTSHQQKEKLKKITVSRTLTCETKQKPQVTQVSCESELFALLIAPSPRAEVLLNAGGKAGEQPAQGHHK